jgi:YidC/Oxa1 family membrane protein insertase
MDNRRIILLMIFSFSLVMLWEAWQKHNLPKPPAQNAAQTSAATPQPSASLQAGAATPTPDGAGDSSGGNRCCTSSTSRCRSGYHHQDGSL